MSLNIKSERVHALARQAAQVTGKSQTSVIEEALVRLLESYGADPEAARIEQTMDVVRRLSADYRDDPGRAGAEIHAVDDLFETATGLPR